MWVHSEDSSRESFTRDGQTTHYSKECGCRLGFLTRIVQYALKNADKNKTEAIEAASDYKDTRHKEPIRTEIE